MERVFGKVCEGLTYFRFMRVAFIARSTLYTVPGGDTVQVLATAKYLQRSGVAVDIKLSADSIDYSAYDLLHFFNIIRPADILKHIRSGKPYVVSTIFVEYAAYDKAHRRGWHAKLLRMCGPGFGEYAKAVARWLTGRDKLVSREYLWRGHNNSVRKIIRHAAMLLPNSESEYRRLVAAYGIRQQYRVIPNGIDPDIFGPHHATVLRTDTVLCVARIEGIKNQLNLIRALNNTSYKLYLIGDPAPNQAGYYRKCNKTAATGIVFVKNVSQPELVQYYSQAKVHVLPGWFETTGLSSLEAAAMGCNVVITDRGDAKEYFGDNAFYCDPASPGSILEAVKKAMAAHDDPALTTRAQALRRTILTKFTWEQAAFATVEAYRAIV